MLLEQDGKTGISCGKYNQVVYKGKFGKNIYSYIKDTDYYRVLFKYKDGSKTYNIEYNFSQIFYNQRFCNLLIKVIMIY